MKRLRLTQWSGQVAAATRPRARLSPAACRFARPQQLGSQIRCQSTTAPSDIVIEDLSSEQDLAEPTEDQALPSPPPYRATQSAKLAALHARLSLPSQLPLETLARTLIDPSADAHPKFNNSNLAYAGTALLSHHTSEWLIARYPRLPMPILFEAMRAYSGEEALNQVARAWGVEPAAAPGEEVDPGLLQFDDEKPTVLMSQWGYARAEADELVKYKWRRGISSRVLYDDPFGDTVTNTETAPSNEVSHAKNGKRLVVENATRNAHANFVRAVVGAIYVHSGREAAKSFIKSHFLSRRLDLSNLFSFKMPTRELARLCAREKFEAPIARLESETGRLSRHPVFVVGIYSGRDKLGEGAASSLDAARILAAINALKSWYLYSPGENVRVPSDMLEDDAKPWTPAYVDIGEVIS